MRWLLIKDLQILRRSPLMVAMLVVYPVLIALMIGFALSSPPGKPRVAIYSGGAPGRGKLHLGAKQINSSDYPKELSSRTQPIRAQWPAAAIADVRDGRALAALIIP